MELIKFQSELLLQRKSDGFNGELKSSGTIIENFIKSIIKKHIPSGYRVCSGYIATPETLYDNSNLLQYDIIIADNRIPAIYEFGVSDIEIVAVESVCGLIEVKRTLTSEVLKSSLAHLKKASLLLQTYDNGIKSTDTSSNLVGMNLNHATHSPFYGIISLAANSKTFNATNKAIINFEVANFCDMIWSISTNHFFAYNLLINGGLVFPCFTSRQLKNGQTIGVFENLNTRISDGSIYRLAIATLRTWINNITGAPLNIEKNHKYFQS